MNKVIFQGKEYLVPASLQEISPSVYKRCLPFLMSNLSEIDKKVKCLEQILNLDKNWRLKIYLTSKIENAKENLKEYTDILKLVDFLFVPENFVFNVFKYLQIKGKKYYSVADRLENMKVREFIFAENYLRAYLDSSSDNDLNLFVACLYRRADQRKNPKSDNFDGDIRVEFNENVLENHAKNFIKINRNVKLAILLFFVESMNLFKKSYPLVFGGESAQSTDTWLDVIMNICEKVTELPSYTNTNLHDFLLFINQKTKKQ